jgi:hypothetical protein
MDGTMADFIVIPIVVVISLAAWLILVYWADSHPRKSPRAAVFPEVARESDDWSADATAFRDGQRDRAVREPMLNEVLEARVPGLGQQGAGLAKTDRR